ncbi:MAG: CopG family transcriptional regulator [Sphingomonas adhaesiva]|uniref:CopG family transcriptional regulator n=1 Tax=Sphingomonas adhaesiva TaxID=28212 RepID=UPI002FFC6411
MNAHRPLRPELGDDTLALVEQLAAARGMSRDDFAAEAIRRVAESEADFAAFVRVGADQIARGEYVTHEEMMQELSEMIERRRR